MSNKNLEKVILMHGKNTNPSQKWYPWLADAVLKNGMQFIAPVLPDSADPRIEKWVTELSKMNKTENNKGFFTKTGYDFGKYLKNNDIPELLPEIIT